MTHTGLSSDETDPDPDPNPDTFTMIGHMQSSVRYAACSVCFASSRAGTLPHPNSAVKYGRFIRASRLLGREPCSAEKPLLGCRLNQCAKQRRSA